MNSFVLFYENLYENINMKTILKDTKDLNVKEMSKETFDENQEILQNKRRIIIFALTASDFIKFRS